MEKKKIEIKNIPMMCCIIITIILLLTNVFLIVSVKQANIEISNNRVTKVQCVKMQEKIDKLEEKIKDLNSTKTEKIENDAVTSNITQNTISDFSIQQLDEIIALVKADISFNYNSQELDTYWCDVSSISSSENKAIETYSDYNFGFDKKGNVFFNIGGTTGKGTYTTSGNTIKCEITKWSSCSGGIYFFETEPVVMILKKENDKTLNVKSIEGKGKVTNFEAGQDNFLYKDMDFTEDIWLNSNFVKE